MPSDGLDIRQAGPHSAAAEAAAVHAYLRQDRLRVRARPGLGQHVPVRLGGGGMVPGDRLGPHERP